MNEKLRTVLKKKYEAEIEDAKYKIECYSQQELLIPDHGTVEPRRNFFFALECLLYIANLPKVIKSSTYHEIFFIRCQKSFWSGGVYIV